MRSSAELGAASSVPFCVKWLNYASTVLNPGRIPHHSISLEDMHAFMNTAPPPPPSLQEQWSVQVWAMPGEPYEVYLLRCLAHQSGLTLLSPHFSVDAQTHDRATQTQQMATPTTPVLVFEKCVVVGLRIEPSATSLVQTGWDTLPCPHCTQATTRAATAVLHPVLPLLYGGDTCETCARAFPVVPAWMRIAYLVLQRSDRTRTAAVAYGDGALRHLVLGASVSAILYVSQTEQQQPLLVVHAAQLSAPFLRAPRHLASSTAAAQHQGTFRTFFEHVHIDYVTKRWASPCRSLADVAEGICPKLLGQTQAKAMVLLVILHAIYCTQRTPKEAPKRPLHLLLLGPAKSGKSELLRGVQLLMGLQAEVLDSTIVHSSGRGAARKASDGASFFSALPSRHRDLLMAGSGMTATTLVLDQLPTSSAAAAIASMKDVLEHQRGCVVDGGIGADTLMEVDLTVHLIAAAEFENVNAVHLAPFFPLVASLTPANSLGDSALISQDVVAASRARASSSRSASRSTSSSLARTPSPGSQRGASLGCGADLVDSCAAAGERLTADDIEYLLQRTAGPEVLDAVVSAEVCYASYLPKLVAAGGLVEAAHPPACAVLPPPSASRGSQWRCASSFDGPAAPEGALAATPLSIQPHLRVLQCLSQARLMLETAEDVSAVGWTAEMRDEVWRLYEHHLVSVADLLHQRSDTQHAIALRGAGCGTALVQSGMVSSGGKKLSKKKCRLLFLEQLHRCQVQSGGGSGGVILPAEVQDLFVQMGGCAAFEDPLDVVIGQLQEEGAMIRQPGGWRVL